MDDDSEFQSQTFQLLGEDNNKFPPSLRSFALPKFDIDEHLQVHLRFDSLIDTEALLGIQGQDSNWIEDFSSGTTAIDFSSTAAECCSITRHNNVWSEAISSESVEILLKSVAEDEMIDKETSIMETDELNVLSGTGDQMDISLRQGNDHKSETGDIGQNVPALPPGKYPRNVSVVDESATGVQPQVEGDVRQSSGCITCMNTQGDPLYAFSNPSLGTGKLDIQSLSDQIVEEQTEISMPERSDLQSNDGQKETSHVTGRDDEVTEQYFNVAETMDCLSSGKGSFLEPIMNSMMLMDEGCNESGYSEKPDGLLEDIAYLIKGTSKENEAGDKSSAQSVGMSKPSNDMCSLTKEEDRSTVTQSGEIGSENLPIPSYATEHSKDVCYKQQDYDSNVNYFHVELPAQNAKINDDHGEEQLDSLMEVTEGKQYPEHDLTENRNSDIGSTSELALEMHANSETQMNKVEDEMGLETNTSSLKSQNLESAVIEKSSQVEAVEDEKSSQVEAVEDSEKPEIEFNASDAKSNDHPLHASLSVAVADVKITSPIANDMVGKKNLVPSTFPIVINVNNDDIIATGKAEDISAGWQNTDTVSVFADSAAKDLMQDGPVTGHALVGVDLISLKEHTIMQQSPPDASNIVDGILEQKRKDSNAQLPREPVTITDPVVAKDPPPKGELQIESGLKHVPLGNKSRDTSALEQKEEATPSSLALELVHSHEKQTAIPANVSLLHSERKIITLVSSGPVAIPVTGDHAPLDSTTKSQPIVYEKPSSYVDSSVSASCQDDPQSSVDKPTSHQSTKFVEGVLIVNDAALKQKGTSDLPAIISQGNDEITSTAAGVANNDVVQTLLEPPTAETGSANYHDKEQDASTITLSKRNAEARLSETVSGKPSAFEPNCGSPAVISCSEHPQDQEGSRVLSEQTSTVSNDGPLISSGAEENGNEVQLSARQVKESSVSEDDRSFTFEVGSLADISEKNTGNEWKPFPSMQSPELPKISKEKSHGSHIESKERKQGPRSKTPNSDKTNRLAVSSNESPTMPQGKFSKETSILKTPTDRDAGSCSVSSTSVATVNRDMDLEESRQYACSENSKMKTSCSPSVQTSSGLPDLNSSVVATAKIYQPFSDLQQVQLRAQIFVYGSLIQGISPDEACMVSAFGGTGGGRSPWEGVWRLSVERYQAQKSPFANSEIPRSAVRVPEKVTGCSSLPSKIFCTSTSQTSGKVVPSSIQNSTPPLPSPVWSVSTHDGLNANMPRGMRLDFNQALTPSHSYYSSQTRHFANKSTLWPSQSPRTGPQGFSVQGSTLTAAATQYSTVPIVETVKLTPVRDSTMSRAPNIQLVSPAALLPILSPASVTKSSVGKVETQGKTATPGTSKHASTIQKPRKRKKAGEPKELGLAIPISQSTTEPSSTIVTKAAPSPSAGLFTSSSTQNNVTCGTLLPTSPVILPAHCQVMNSNCSEQRAIFSEETSSRIEQAKLQAEEAAALAAASGRHSQDIWSQLAAQRDSGLVSEVEVKLASAAVAASTIQKPRKRKKAGEPKELGLAIPISQSTTEPSSTIVTKAAPSPSAGLFTSSSTQNNVTCGTLLPTSPVILPAHCQVMNSNCSEQRAIFSEETSSRIEQAKLQAEEAAASVRHSQDIWSQLAAQRDSGLVSEVEVKLASAAVAASTIQKPRKRKKAGEPKEFGLAIPISQSTTEPSSTIVTKAAPSPSSTQNNVTCGTLLLTSPVILPAHCQVMNSNSSEQRAIFSEEISSRIEQAKLQAEEAAALAAASVRHSQDIWSQLAAQRDSGLVSEVEVKLASAAVAASAAASVAKAAAAAAKVASDAALQAKMMADEILSLARTGNLTQSSEKIDGSSSVISAARETARRRVEEASAATKRAENIDAIVKAAELAAEAVSQAGAIIAMGDPLPFNLSELIESGPEGFWKSQRPGSEKLNANKLPVTKDMGLNDSDHHNGLVKQSNGQLLNKKDIQQTVSEGEISRNEQSVMLGGNYQEGGLGNAATVHNNRQENDSLSTNLKESDIQKGSFVEVVSDDDGLRGAWYSARVLDVKDMKAYVCHDYLLNDKGSGQLKEWVPLEGADDVAPRIRGTHPLATSEHEGTRKRRREAVGNYAWEVGDRVDAWMRDGWWEGIVTEKNQGDETKLTVHFPAGGDSSVVQAWNLRLSRIWKDGQWAEWSRTRENTLQPYEGDTPQEKRQKLNRPEARFDAEVDSRGIGNLSKKAPLEDSRKPEEPRPLNLSAKDKIFSVGRNARDDGVSDTNRVRRTGLQKEGSRVVFGVPKPGKKRKFMEVSKHYVLDNKTDKTREENDSLKFPRYLMPQQSRPWKNTSKVDPKGKQAGESNKPRGLKTLKSQTSQIRSTTEKDTSSISTTSVSNAVDNGRSALPNSRVGIGDKCYLEKNPVEVVSFPSSVGTTASLPNSHVQAVPGAPAAKKKAATSKVNKPSRSEDKGSENFIKAMPDSIEPRRSNRRIQPTSRLLEGLQSSLIISKIPSFSQDKGARHRGTSSRGNTRG